ncbi:hypothetical protein McpSp1_04860 [Methanocorpusculaceae archaeon Sp1]|nr:hypothetical protein [Methanocorpusculaceae archaeon Sp1]
MEFRATLFNLIASVLIICLCLIPAAVADDGTAASGDAPRSFADVPSWITGGLGVKTPSEGGYYVNENPPEHPGGFSDINRADSARAESEVPSWILAAAGVSSIAVIVFASLHFLPIMIGKTREAPPSPVRDRIFDEIREAPGSSASALREKIGIHHATLRYHLAVLEREQQIVSRNAGHTYYYFPNGSTLSYLDTVKMTLCKNPTTGKILELIEQDPGISGTVLAARAGITSGTLTWHLGKLEKNDLVTVERAGRGMRIFPHE